MPGSGKSTSGQMIVEQLSERNISHRFYHELDDNHPLRIYDKEFTSFTIKEEAEWFTAKVKQLFSQFVSEHMHTQEVVIVKAYMFQNTIGFAYNMGMPAEDVLTLTADLQQILSPLEPVLIYYYQMNVEQNWRWICELRGPGFTEDRCGIYNDEDFITAGEFWTKNQNFINTIVQEWDIPKLIIHNQNYLWDEYKERILNFLHI